MRAFIWIGHCNGGHELRDLEFARYAQKKGIEVTLGMFKFDPLLNFEQKVFKPFFPKKLQGLNNLHIAKKISSSFLDQFDFVFGRFKNKTKAFKVFRVAGDLDKTWIPSKKSRMLYNYIKKREEKFLKDYDLVFGCNNDAMSYLLRKGIKCEKSSNFVDINIFDIKNQKKVTDVLFVGRNDRIKNFNALKLACEELNLRLVAIGCDDWISQNKLSYYYNATRLVVLPSFYETFGNVVLESLASATPVLCSKSVTAARELLPYVYVCDTDKESIKKKITEILGDYGSALKKALDGYHFVRQNLSSEKILAHEISCIVSRIS